MLELLELLAMLELLELLATLELLTELELLSTALVTLDEAEDSGAELARELDATEDAGAELAGAEDFFPPPLPLPPPPQATKLMTSKESSPAWTFDFIRRPYIEVMLNYFM